MHIVSKFQFFIHVFAMVKLKKKIKSLKGGEIVCFLYCTFSVHFYKILNKNVR